MIDIVYLKKSGLFTRFARKYQKIERPLAYYLHHTPVIEKGFSVFDLMNILKENEKEVNLLFMAYTRGFTLAPFYEEMNSNVAVKKEDALDCLEFSLAGEIDNLNEFGKPKYEISHYVHINGIKKTDKERYSIGFSPLSELSQATIVLNNEIEFSIMQRGEIWETEKKPTKKVFFTGIKEFMLEDILGPFLHEITFYGYPKDRNMQLEELEERVETSKTEDCIPWEVIQLEWKEKDLVEWQKKNDGKTKSLKIEKLEKEIAFLKKKLGKE